MSLAVLSNEILAEIINCLDGSLTGITLCSRQLHSIAEPILYSNIHLNCPKSYTNFIRTIVAKPYLVGYVRHFRTEGHPYGWDYDLSFLSAKDRKWVRSQLPNSVHGKATCEKWFKKMFFKPNVNWVEVPMYWDAITAFLLTLFSPTLQTIQMDSYGPSSNHHPYNEYTYTEMVLEASTPTGGGPFHRLKEVTILPSGILPVHLIIPFLQVPSVTKFKASELKLIREPFKPALHTTDLTLTGCRLLGNQLMSFLLCFRSLKRLTYHHAAPRLSMLVASHLRRGLANSKGTLGELILIQELDDEWPGDDSASNSDESGFAGSGSSVASKQYVLGSLQTFEKLKTLHIESTFLLPVEPRRRALETPHVYSDEDCLALAESFSPSLQHLTLDISPSVFSEISSLLSKSMAMSHTHHLETFHLSFRHSFTLKMKRFKTLVGQLEELRETVGEMGVDLSWNCMCGPPTPFGCYDYMVKA